MVTKRCMVHQRSSRYISICQLSALVHMLRVELITRFGMGKQPSSRLAHQRLLGFVCLPLQHSAKTEASANVAQQISC